MAFRIIAAILVLLAGYALFQIGTVWRLYHNLYNPESAFTVKNDGNQTDITIVEFLNYDCNYCRDTHKVLLDYAESNKNVRLVVRPFPDAKGFAEEAAEMALAAGVQGKFWEMDQAIIEYDGKPDERFYRETAGLFDIDYEKMRKDADAPDVQEMVGSNADGILLFGIKKVPAIMIDKTIYQLDKPLTLADLISMVAGERAR
jgi:protein-disulfide isomerase